MMTRKSRMITISVVTEIRETARWSMLLLMILRTQRKSRC